MTSLDEPEYIFGGRPKIKCRECITTKTWFWEEVAYKQHLKLEHVGRRHGRRGRESGLGADIGDGE